MISQPGWAKGRDEMARTVADQFAEILAAAGVKRIYGIVGDSLNGLIVLAFRLSRSSGADRRAGYRLFAFSISYLFILFASLLAGHGGDRSPSAHSVRVGLRPAEAAPVPCPVRIA